MDTRLILFCSIFLLILGCKREEYELESNFYAMGGNWQIKIKTTNPIKGRKILKEIEELTREYQEKFSKFDEKSELSLLNRSKNLTVSKELYSLIKKTIYFSELTNGFFDITLKNNGYKNIKLLRDNQIRLEGDIELDLGGTAVGFVVDKISQILDKNKIKKYYINAAGDIKTKGEYLIGIKEPRVNLITHIISLNNKAISTSSRWVDSVELKHIINPKTGQYVEDNDTAVVISKDSIFADALSTALLVGGIEILKILEKKGADGILFVGEKILTTPNIKKVLKDYLITSPMYSERLKEFFVKRAIDEEKKENYKDAIFYLKKAIKISPDEPGLYHELGRLYEKIDKDKEAVYAYLEALKRAKGDRER